MIIPQNIPLLKWVIMPWAVMVVVWAILEGRLGWTVLLGTFTSLIIVGVIVKKYLTGRKLSLGIWLVAAALMGLGFGLGSAILTLLFMAVKSGLHAHGPEFSALEVTWVLEQIPVWSAAGLMGGLGVGLLLRAVTQPDH